MADLPIGLAIRTTRIKKGLTQGQVSENMGSPRSYVWKIENDRVRPYLEQFVRFADAMGEDPAELLSYTRQLQREAEE